LDIFIFIIVTVSAISLALTYIITSFAFIIRMVGAIDNINAKSWNLSSAILLLNSFFVAISLSMIAFILDYSPNLNILIILFGFCILIIFFGHLIMIKNFNLILKIIKKLSNIYFDKELIKFSNAYNLSFYKFDYTVFIAWICFLIGFIFPSILAVIFNEYRTTLFQLSFIFNSIGTLITTVITDRQASLLSDKENPSKLDIDNILQFLSNILINRIIATTIVFFIIVLVYFLFLN